MSELQIYKGMVKKIKGDEIKEMDKIVYDLLLKLEQCDDKHNRCDYLMEHDEITYLLDYITNLQQENEDNLKCIKSIKEQLESVINENQKLLKQWFENNDKTVELISEKEIYYENFKDYKSRCEKAVEYIKINFVEDIITVKTLLNILNGDKSE